MSRLFRSALLFMIGILATVPLLAAEPLPLPPLRYSITDLGTLGGNNSVANAINDRGQVTGTADTASGQQHTFLYSGGPLIDLSNLSREYSYGQAINNQGIVTGKVVGTSAYSGGRPFISSGGPLRTFISRQLYYDGNYPIIGYGINDQGMITGIAQTRIGVEAFLYSRGQMKLLGTLDHSKISYGTAINARGDITGFSENGIGGRMHAMLYRNGKMSDLRTLSGGSESFGWAINEAGQVAGTSEIDVPAENGTHLRTGHAFLYDGKGKDGSGMTDLGTLPSASDSDARAINDGGEIVGQSGQRAFVYLAGRMWDLNSLLGSADGNPEWLLTEARGINNKGQIVGVGLHLHPHGSNFFAGSDRDSRAFLLTPIGIGSANLPVRDTP